MELVLLAMTSNSNRFQITPINDNIASQPSEIIPLINIEIPSPPPTSITPINEINKTSVQRINNLLHRSKLNSSGTKIDSSVISNSHSNSYANLTVEDNDSCYSTVHSNSHDGLGNKFLQELRSKRHELREKTKHLSIDQRIAIIRHKHNREKIRAQDIFDVNFELTDDDDKQSDLINEDTQEQIRHDIFHELDRQRRKQFQKQHRHLVLGRAFLMFITSFIAFMSITLIYVVIHLIDKVKYFDTDPEFLPMIYDATVGSESND